MFEDFPISQSIIVLNSDFHFQSSSTVSPKCSLSSCALKKRKEKKKMSSPHKLPGSHFSLWCHQAPIWVSDMQSADFFCTVLSLGICPLLWQWDWLHQTHFGERKELQIGTNSVNLCHCTGVTKLSCYFTYAPFLQTPNSLSSSIERIFKFFPQTFLPNIYRRKKIFARQYLIICYLKNQVYGYQVPRVNLGEVLIQPIK